MLRGDRCARKSGIKHEFELKTAHSARSYKTTPHRTPLEFDKDDWQWFPDRHQESNSCIEERNICRFVFDNHRRICTFHLFARFSFLFLILPIKEKRLRELDFKLKEQTIRLDGEKKELDEGTLGEPLRCCDEVSLLL